MSAIGGSAHQIRMPKPSPLGPIQRVMEKSQPTNGPYFRGISSQPFSRRRFWGSGRSRCRGLAARGRRPGRSRRRARESEGGHCSPRPRAPSPAGLLRADLPDHAGAGDLDKRSIGGILETGIGVGAPKIANRTIIGDIGAAIWAEPNIGRPVEPADAVRESLLEGLVVRKALQVQRGRLTPSAGEIEQLDLVSRLRRRRVNP